MVHATLGLWQKMSLAPKITLTTGLRFPHNWRVLRESIGCVRVDRHLIPLYSTIWVYFVVTLVMQGKLNLWGFSLPWWEVHDGRGHLILWIQSAVFPKCPRVMGLLTSLCWCWEMGPSRKNGADIGDISRRYGVPEPLVLSVLCISHHEVNRVSSTMSFHCDVVH